MTVVAREGGSPSTLVQDVRIVGVNRIVERGWVLFRDGLVAATGAGDPAAAIGEVPSAQRVDGRGGWLTPGFIDIHGHGGGGASFDDGGVAVATALAVHRAHGTTRSMLSLVSAERTALLRRLAELAELARQDPLILGVHLEGPFLAAAHRGAHDPAVLRSAAGDEVDELLGVGGDRLRMVTLAPELPGGMEAIRQITAAGPLAALGHTSADYATASAAFDAGVRVLTHTFNGMPGLHHRRPGPVAAAIDHGDVALELIADGVHVHPSMVRGVFERAPGRTVLITDAMAAAGLGDGDYRLGTLDVRVVDGVAMLTDGSSIAGSVLTSDAALRFAITAAGVPVVAAVAALTATPAALFGLGHHLGRLEPGFIADAVLLDPSWNVVSVWAEGRRLR